MDKSRFTRGKGFTGATIPKSGNEQADRLENHFEIYKWPRKPAWISMRFIGSLTSYALHWFDIKGKGGKAFSFAKPCLAWSHELGATDTEKLCPYCDIEKGRLNVKYYMNAIDRGVQEEYSGPGKMTAAEQKTGFKDLESVSRTPVVVVSFPTTVSAKLQERSESNIHKVKTKSGKVIKKSFDISHVRFGRDISLKFDKNKTGSDMYEIERGDHSPLTEEELDYLIWDIEDVLELEDDKSASAEAGRIAKMHHKEEDKTEEEDEEETYDADEARSPKKKASKSAPVVEEDEEDAFAEEDEEVAPPKKASRKKHKVVEEEDEVEEEPEEEEDDLEEEDAPPPKRKRSSKPAPVEEEDFDEDDIPF